MIDRTISEQDSLGLSKHQESSRQTIKLKPYIKPTLQPLNTSSGLIEGSITTGIFENSAGLFGGS